MTPSITTVGSYQYNALGQRIQKVVSLPTSSTYLVTRKDLRSLKNALRAAGRNETLSTVCTALETWVDNELNQFKGGNKDYRADAQQLVDQLKSCILAEAKYNSVKQTILSQADTGPTNSTTTFTFGLGGELLSEINTTTNTQKDYVYLNGKPLAMIKHTNNAGVITSQIYTIHNDHLGTPQAMTNSAGVTVWNASYGPFGKGTPNQDVNNDGIKVTLNIRFPGQYYDKEAGLHYNYFRVYDPNSGRYITSDPIGLAGGLNTFGYVNANPIMLSDRLGLRGLDPLKEMLNKLVSDKVGDFLIGQIELEVVYNCAKQVSCSTFRSNIGHTLISSKCLDLVLSSRKIPQVNQSGAIGSCNTGCRVLLRKKCKKIKSSCTSLGK